MKKIFFLKKILKNIFLYDILGLVKKAKKVRGKLFWRSKCNNSIGGKSKNMLLKIAKQLRRFLK